jgi:integrase
MRRPPKYVQQFIDRHGRARFYFRRAGFKPAALPGLPWSPEFMAAYDTARTGQIAVGASRTKPGTLKALAAAYYGSARFSDMEASTQNVYRNIIERLCEQRDQDGNELADKRIATLEREHIVKLIQARADKPGSANSLRKVLRAMMQHAVDIGWRDDDPTRDVKKLRSKNDDGFHSWTEAEIDQFERRHPIGTKPRLALSLLLYLGQRRGDTVRMGRQHIRKIKHPELGWIDAIHVEQEKTGMVLDIPIHENLAAIIADTPNSNLTFLVTEYGKPFSPAGFGNWFREQCDAAGLHHCSAHGLRRAAGRRLAEAGCTANETAAVLGHASLKEVQRYTKAADRTKLAVAAMKKMAR